MQVTPNTSKIKNFLQEYYFVLLLAIVFSAACFLIHRYDVALRNSFTAAKSTLRNKIEAHGAEIIEGAIIESPSVILQINDAKAFIEKMNEIDAKTVYVYDSTLKYEEDYYVFSENYAVAFRFTLRQSTLESCYNGIRLVSPCPQCKENGNHTNCPGRCCPLGVANEAQVFRG